MAWYEGQVTRVGALEDVARGRLASLEARIDGLRANYRSTLEDNATEGMVLTLLIPFIAFFLVRLVRRAGRRFEEEAPERRRRGDDRPPPAPEDGVPRRDHDDLGRDLGNRTLLRVSPDWASTSRRSWRRRRWSAWRSRSAPRR